MPEWKPKILCRLALVKLSPTREAEIVDELSQNLEDRYQEHLASGQSQDAAFRTSLDELNDENLLARGLASPLAFAAVLRADVGDGFSRTPPCFESAATP